MHINLHNSSQLLLHLPDPAFEQPIAIIPSRSLAKLINLLGNRGHKHLPMLRTTAMHISNCLDMPTAGIEIADLAMVGPSLKRYLEGRRYKRNAVRSYMNFVRILVAEAHKLGWDIVSPELQAAWGDIFRVARKQHGLKQVVKYALTTGKTPAQFGDEDLDRWKNEMSRQGRNHEYVQTLDRQFRKLAANRSDLPRISVRSSPWFYGAQLSEFPDCLRSQVEALIQWKTAPLSHGRPAKYRHRKITAYNFLMFLRQLFAFVKKSDKTPLTLEQLISRDNVLPFAAWLKNERGSRSASLIPFLGMLHASASRYPDLAGRDYSWIRKFIVELPQDDSTLTAEAKERKWVSYDKLISIPDRIRTERLKLEQEGKNSFQVALLARDELLMRWITALPWRQRNFRECKLAPKANGGNLFLEEIPRSTAIALPQWVREKHKEDPQARFWQAYFRADETKTARPIHIIVPRTLIETLEEYVSKYRPYLSKESSGLLFLNSKGRPFRALQLRQLIGRITARHVGRRVTPHLFRDIFAVKYLEENPEDYLTLSKILWHNNLNTTLRIYGRKFDESHGACKAEEWLERRPPNPEPVKTDGRR